MLVSVFLIVIVEKSMWFIVASMYLGTMGILCWGLNLVYFVYATSKDHNSPLTRDLERDLIHLMQLD